MTRDESGSIMAAGHLISPPGLLASALEDMALEGSVPRPRLLNMLRLDPGLAVVILSAANERHRYQHRAGGIDTLRAAVNVLGDHDINRLLLCRASVALGHGSYRLTQWTQRQNWRTAVGVAFAAEWVAEITGLVDPEEAYVAGLLVDLGKWLWSEGQPDIDPAEAAGQLARTWGLSAALVEVIGGGCARSAKGKVLVALTRWARGVGHLPAHEQSLGPVFETVDRGALAAARRRQLAVAEELIGQR